jgi:hypothetical protein
MCGQQGYFLLFVKIAGLVLSFQIQKGDSFVVIVLVDLGDPFFLLTLS